MPGISNGRLLAMSTENRSQVIAGLSPDVRRKLANLASLGAHLEMQKAADHVALAAELTADGRGSR